ncbi:MAG TPA: hypothetical protein VGE52_18265, partial [Pirellulales bacterium]
ANSVALRGDDHEFDNTFYVTPPRKQHVSVAYLGDDRPDDPQGWQYYLRLALSGDAFREVELVASSGDAPSLLSALPPQWVVLAKPLSDEKQKVLQQYVEQGGSLLVLTLDGETNGLATYFDDVESPAGESPAGRGRENDFYILGEIDFTHPLFSPLANPRYNDFTRIHFWRRREITLKPDASTRVLARFDDGSPWLIEKTLGRGRIWGLTSGWRPDDGQLAASSKFVALTGGWLDLAAGAPPSLAGTLVGAPISLPRDRTEPLTIKSPDGKVASIGVELNEYRDAMTPGLYEIGSGASSSRAAVNLAPSESDTAPLAMERLEQFGVPLGTTVSRAERLDRLRQERDVELESRQQIWRWLLVAGLLFVILETGWAARSARVPAAPSGAAV